MQENQSVIERVDALLYDAIKKHASDIHVESTHDGLRVRYRIDGVLYTQSPIDLSIADQVIARLKVLAHIDMAEKRIPQDGKFQVTLGADQIDLRFSTFPSIWGQKIVVRILDRKRQHLSLASLGFAKQTLAQFQNLLARNSGFILVVGPTGSGKTTTLYAALSALNAPEKNIITLEDPVEYNIEGITQGQINPNAGFTFEKGLRAMLRQDPDIVMIGEVRDKQTAQVAIESSLTGHLVLSTVHTNNAPSVITRLMDMGVQPFLINAAISGVVAQRLARTICTGCKHEVAPTEEDITVMKVLGLSCATLYAGAGCDACFGLGYKGRIGIFELLTMTSALRDLIVHHPRVDDIYLQSCTDGMVPMLQDGAQKVREGIITLQELVRVLG